MSTTALPPTVALPHAQDLPTAPLQPEGPHFDARDIPATQALDYRSRLRALPLSAARRGHYLAIEDGPDPAVLPLRERVVHVGRAVTAAIRLEDFRVSRDHAVFVRHGEHVRVLDNRSTSGTYVNDVRVSALNLQDGDVVSLGPVCLRYVWVD